MTLEAHLPVLPVAVPLATAPIVALLSGRRLPWAAATAAVAFCFVVALQLAADLRAGGQIAYQIGGWQPPYGIVLELDALNSLLLVLVTGASLIGLIFGQPLMAEELEERRHPYFYTAWLLSTAGLSGILITGDAFNIFVFLEISSLGSYVLFAGGPDRRALTATFKYLIMGTIGGTFYLVGVGLIYMMTGTLNIEDMAERLGMVEQTRPLFMAAGFITVGLALKGAVFPLHSWMPNAYARAPSAVAVYMSACATKVSLYILFRMDFTVFQPNLGDHDVHFSGFVILLAAAGFVMGSLIAVFQKDIKRLLGYSSVGQLGYIVAGFALISATGVQAGVMHMFNHALIKITLFMAVCSVAFRLGRGEVLMRDMAGVARFMPWTMAAFVIAGLSIVGVPGTAGFVSKWYLVLAMLERGGVQGTILVSLVLFSSLLALVYIWRVVEQAYFTQRPANAEAVREAPLGLLLPLLAGALANLYFGLFPAYPLGLAEQAAQILAGGRP